MKLIRNGLSAIAVAASVILPSAAASAETLSDALVSAYKTSGLLDQQRALLRVQDENVAVAVSALRPVLSYAATFGRTLSDPVGAAPLIDSYNASLSLSASLLLFDFGATDTRIEIARENVLMARETLVGVEQSVFLRAIASYVNVISAQENVSLQANNVRLITQELRAARDRFDVGEVTQTDVSTAEARLAGGRATEAAAKGELMIAREEYKAAIGHYPKSLSGLPRLPKLPRPRPRPNPKLKHKRMWIKARPTRAGQKRLFQKMLRTGKMSIQTK
jgi:outer membrane protein